MSLQTISGIRKTAAELSAAVFLITRLFSVISSIYIAGGCRKHFPAISISTKKGNCMQKTIEEIKEMPVWLLWHKQNNRGRVAKVPIAASGGPCGTDEKYQNDWVTYNEALQAVETRNADGVGFKIPGGMFFLDIDHRDLDDGLVQEMLSRYNSYSEYSVSGEGIHIYGLCDISQLPTYIDSKSGKLKLSSDFYMHHPENGLELYFGELTNRYAAFTGNIILDRPLMDCTEAILYTLNRYMKKKTAETSIDREANKAIDKLRKQKNGDKFGKIFDYGEWDGVTDHSKLDAALCALIAFCTGDNPELIDAVFRKSALYREKWERDDYRNRTIRYGVEAACRKMSEQYYAPQPTNTPKTTKKEVPSFIKVDDKKRKKVSAPLLAKYAREHLDYILVRDNGNQTTMKYVYENGVYKLYDLNMLYGAVKRYIADYDEELVTMGVVKEAVGLMLSDLTYLSQETLNADEDLINFQNGLLRVTADTVQLLPHSPKVLSTIQIPCDWKEEKVPTPCFDKYMHTLTNGDDEIKQLLLEYMGACISQVQGWRMKKALFLVGEGNTGKSQLKSLTERLLGRGNFIGIDLDEIEARFGTGAIYGTRLAGSSDMSFISVNELKTFKKITGGDSLFTEFKGQQPFHQVYTGLLWFCMNRLPKFSGDMGQWVYDRIMIVNCNNVIPLDKQDKQLLDKMYAEKEGIVQKCIKALQNVIANGYRFSEPKSVVNDRAQYQATNSTVISFFEECMCPWPDGKIGGSTITTGTIHKVYLQWCKSNNNGYARSAKEFRDELASHLGTRFADMTTRCHGNTYYKGWTLTEDAQNDFRQAL